MEMPVARITYGSYTSCLQNCIQRSAICDGHDHAWLKYLYSRDQDPTYLLNFFLVFIESQLPIPKSLGPRTEKGKGENNRGHTVSLDCIWLANSAYFDI